MDEDKRQPEPESPEKPLDENILEEAHILEKYIGGRNITEHRDPITMIKINTVIFLTRKEKAYDRQNQDLLQHKFIAKFNNKLDLGQINCIKKGKYHYLGICVYDSDNPTAVTWRHISEGLHNLSSYMTSRKITSVIIPKFREINSIPWKKLEHKIKTLFQPNKTQITICAGIVTYPPLNQRADILEEGHCSALAGHKGVSKTFARIRAFCN